MSTIGARAIFHLLLLIAKLRTPSWNSLLLCLELCPAWVSGGWAALSSFVLGGHVAEERGALCVWWRSLISTLPSCVFPVHLLLAANMGTSYILLRREGSVLWKIHLLGGSLALLPDLLPAPHPHLTMLSAATSRCGSPESWKSGVELVTPTSILIDAAGHLNIQWRTEINLSF